MSPAEELRAAAARIREVAGKAEPGPWCPDYAYAAIRHVQRNCSIECGTHDERGEDCRSFDMYDGPFVAMWHPGVAVLVAEVFDKWARMGELDPDLLHRVGGPETLALARAINGGAS